jgi:hypothetical protein
MSVKAKYRFYIVDEGGEVMGTNSEETAQWYEETSLIIDVTEDVAEAPPPDEEEDDDDEEEEE